MTRLLISLTLRAWYSLTSPIDVDAEQAAAFCKTGGCCDRCSSLNENGSQSCIGCSGASSAGDCNSGQTFVPCPQGQCWHGSGKIVIAPSGGNDACE